MSQISSKAIAEHSSRDSCWIIVHGKVYDVTDFLDGALNFRVTKREELIS